MINKQETLNQLHSLKLKGMASVYEGSFALPSHESLSAHELLARMAQAELQHRVDQKTTMYLKLSKLRYDAMLEQVQCTPERNLSRDQLLELSDCSFIDRSENVLITGATGCGKSYLGCAIGRQACAMGYRTIYFGMNRFIERIAQAKLDGTYIKLLNQLEKVHLLILDDFGIAPMDYNVKLTLLQLLEDRYERRSIVIASQLPVSSWHEFINEPTLADAIMDRLAVSSIRFELKGDSLRKRKKK
jgi:DNA replication protein DnaC